ncbi:hypothetical protein F4703DRAFT_1789000 [Phycomyces blakesleeanus]
MNTPPPERSKPISSSPSLNTYEAPHTRPRRHTVARPESALGLLSGPAADDDEDQQETFDRISDILSTLIQEANEAVHGIESERARLIKSNNSIVPSKLPRPKRTRTPSFHARDLPEYSIPISPISPAPSPIPGTFSKRHSRSMSARPLSCPALAVRRSATPRLSKRISSPLIQQQDPLAESFKRLDSSMALVDSLSRDLASPVTQQPQSSLPLDPRFSGLLLLPLLHIPHALISMAFDSLPSQRHSSPTSLTSMLTWAFFFVLANLMVDRLVVSTAAPILWLSVRTRRLSLPGSFQPSTFPSILPPTSTSTSISASRSRSLAAPSTSSFISSSSTTTNISSDCHCDTERTRKRRMSRRPSHTISTKTHKKTYSVQGPLPSPIETHVAIRRTTPQTSWSVSTEPKPRITRRCSF